MPANYRDRLDLREQIDRIDRASEEASKFMAEQHRLMANGSHNPWILIAGAIVAGAFTRLPEILHAFGFQM